jgi:glycosyltransferase involved in cell wall biosynthesis
MKVSIIIPVVYNRGWLDECIQSALAQDFNDYEIILASDGNPEMYDYARKYNLNFSLSIKKNLSTNYNHAVKIARGDYLKMLMDDDVMTPNCLKDLYENIGDADMIYASAVNFKANGSSIIIKPYPATFKSVYERDGIHTGTIMINRSTFEALGGNDENLNCMEDYDLNLNLLSHGYKLTYVNKVVYRYRVHPGQKSFRMTPERINAKKYIRNKYREFYKKIV